MRINSPPPHDNAVVELLGVAGEGETGDYSLVTEGLHPPIVIPSSPHAGDDMDMLNSPTGEGLRRANSSYSSAGGVRRSAGSMLRYGSDADMGCPEKAIRGLSGLR